MHPEFNAFTVTATDYVSVLGQLTRWTETRGATETITSVTFTRERDDPTVTAVVVHTHGDNPNIRTIPVDQGATPAPPKIIVLLRGVTRDSERGLIATGELAKRLGGGWDAKSLGEAMRRAGIPAPAQPKRRRRGYTNPISVTDLGQVRAAVDAYFDH